MHQHEESYDGNISKVDEEDTEVIPDKVDDTQMTGSKPAWPTHLQTMKVKKRPTRKMVA